jgi:hypothetical protein
MSAYHATSVREITISNNHRDLIMRWLLPSNIRKVLVARGIEEAMAKVYILPIIRSMSFLLADAKAYKALLPTHREEASST